MVSRTGVRGDVWLRAAWEAASDAMALSDPDGIVLTANPAYFRLYGFEPGEVIGQPFSIIFPPETRCEAEALYQEVFRSAEHPPAYERIVRRRDGTERTVSARVSFLEEDGTRVAMLNIIQDITDEVAVRHLAAAAEHERHIFLSSVSHDIKNPLAAIKGHAQMLRRIVERTGEPPPQDKLVGGLEQIETSAGRLARLVDELVEVAARAAGDVPPLSLATADLVTLAHGAAARHRQIADYHKIAVEATVETLLGRWDVDRVERVFDNLVTNAIKYSPEGGVITLRVEPSGAEALLTVTDQGAGIPPDDLPHVFERYRRGANVDPSVLGSGVGLTSVKHIVEQHGGTVGIESREGLGTTVTVRLPLDPSLSPPEEDV
jgi:PAS domain S-box-containing protein